MRISAMWTAMVGAAAALGALGCGGATFSAGSGDAGGGDSSPAPPDAEPYDSGGDDSAPSNPLCPLAAPTTGTACDADMLECEYGDAFWNVSCDVVMQCAGGRWSVESFPALGGCTPKPGPNPSSCPPDYASVPSGSTCSKTDLLCTYLQGVCTCEAFLGGPVQVDGGGGG